MRWVPWALGTAGVLQYAIIAALQPSDYVSLDTAYLVMWLAIIGGLVVCYLSCWDGCGYGGGCDCCGDDCSCGDCSNCGPRGGEGHGHGEHGHEGHMH